MKNIINGAVFGTGAVIMCAVGRSISLTWTEIAFIAGVLMVVVSGLRFSREEISDGEAEDTELQGQQTMLC